ncbi:MAG: hypothetical protein AUJ74_03265 [Candidatus Omnitrophica bacterium CG1_02_44_16]|nr:MAG: hypothetical protein AUJ74_03265 [Candidatus Omnitrophica bacterium CG1_02_44_16]PIY83236.1 MAG: hypothetical protein COY78_02935 [Candidatus Omnitrophica bacterium CG_4_10_14_0_8_um_filter_44_12]PIZ83199.1 MAG: hypothetical protein COX96_08905 [Candidatus Omnitrophica bacterium CG_4_10_14_0_2_um_filter_44_9]
MKRRIKSLAIIFMFSWFSLCAFRAYADEVPTLSLKDSIPISEKALTQAKVDLTKYYLYQVEYSLSSDGSYWFQTYRLRSSGSNEIFVKVYMNAKTEVSGI